MTITANANSLFTHTVPTWWEGGEEAWWELVDYKTNPTDTTFTPVFRRYEFLVGEVAHNRVNSGASNSHVHVPAEDREAMAMKGLYDAIETYDPSRKVPFLAYARLTMNRRFVDQIRSEGPYRRAEVDFLRCVTDAMDAITALGEEPTRGAIADWIAATGKYTRANAESRIELAWIRRYDVFSLSSSGKDDGEDTYDIGAAVADRTAINPEQAAIESEESEEVVAYVQHMLAKLNDRDRNLLTIAMLDPDEQAERAAAMGITMSDLSERIRRARANARKVVCAELGVDAEVPDRDEVADIIASVIPSGYWRRVVNASADNRGETQPALARVIPFDGVEFGEQLLLFAS